MGFEKECGFFCSILKLVRTATRFLGSRRKQNGVLVLLEGLQDGKEWKVMIESIEYML